MRSKSSELPLSYNVIQSRCREPQIDFAVETMQSEQKPLNSYVLAESEVPDSKEKSNLNFNGRISEQRNLTPDILNLLYSFILLNMATIDEICDRYINLSSMNVLKVEKFLYNFWNEGTSWQYIWQNSFYKSVWEKKIN